MVWSKCFTAIRSMVWVTIGCEKTTPACLMAAATGQHSRYRAFGRADAEPAGSGASARSGTIVWKARELLAKGEIDYQGFVKTGGFFGSIDRYCKHDGTARP
ncbi:hypothetical protein [Brucella sp. NF 2810]|uniref:hypothetical protein n=1 Tax=Brucella sp. NF 2810 TaxID=3419591 RepID=UPI003D1833D5